MDTSGGAEEGGVDWRWGGWCVCRYEGSGEDEDGVIGGDGYVGDGLN